MMFTLSFTALGAISIRYLRMQAWRLTSLPKKGLHADVRLHLLISYVWVGLPPFLSLPLSSQRTLCLGFFLPFCSCLPPDCHSLARLGNDVLVSLDGRCSGFIGIPVDLRSLLAGPRSKHVQA